MWVIEKAIPQTEHNLENIQTRLMRGWVDILHESIPTVKLNLDVDAMKPKYEVGHGRG